MVCRAGNRMAARIKLPGEFIGFAAVISAAGLFLAGAKLCVAKGGSGVGLLRVLNKAILIV